MPETDSSNSCPSGRYILGFIASLLEVQNKINNSKYCQDVFVTEDGLTTKPIIGWITNNKVQELGKV